MDAPKELLTVKNSDYTFRPLAIACNRDFSTVAPRHRIQNFRLADTRCAPRVTDNEVQPCEDSARTVTEDDSADTWSRSAV